MSERLKIVGLDLGTTTTQMVLSELTVENRASGFAVPQMEIVDRRILYQSPVHFTPLLDGQRMDAQALRRILEAEYANAGIRREDVDTGAVIVTGETSRKENAQAVLEALSDLAGDFVVAAAGPDLESVLAAKGAEAPERSEALGKDVLHMDIGGGTSNLALLREGQVLRTGCLNVGGRLVKLDPHGTVTYVSEVLEGICDLKPGQKVTQEQLEPLAGTLVRVLEMAAGRRPPADLLEKLATREARTVWEPPGEAVISFSGGVADCIEQDRPWLAFGDLGPVLGRAIRRSRLCGGDYVLGRQTIRATVIGAGCHSAQLSGSTVFCQNVPLPLKNVPVVRIHGWQDIRQKLGDREEPAVLALEGQKAPSYAQVVAMAEGLLRELRGQVLICLEQDMAKALGQALAARLPPSARILCIDRIRVDEGSYLDIGAPVGQALPVVIKTLVFGRQNAARRCL